MENNIHHYVVISVQSPGTKIGCVFVILECAPDTVYAAGPPLWCRPSF